NAGPTALPRTDLPWTWIAATAISVLAAATIFTMHLRETHSTPRVLRYNIPLPTDGHSEGVYFNFHLSPDGRLVATSAVLQQTLGIFVRELDSWDFRV